jgi:hypothetical protein
LIQQVCLSSIERRVFCNDYFESCSKFAEVLKMLKVSGLPIEITKSGLDGLFSRYGEIQITENSVVIKIENDQSIAYVELDKNENAAREALDGKLWLDKFFLRVDKYRGDGNLILQPGSKP